MTALDTVQVLDRYTDAFEHLAAELEWLDLTLTRGVLDLRRAVPTTAPDPTLHVSDDEVDQLLAAARARPRRRTPGPSTSGSPPCGS